MSGVFNFARNSRISTASEYAMDSGSIFFDPSARGHGNMLFLGNGDSLFRGGAREESLKKRPFFSSPEEVFDDEYYDEQLPEKKRRLTAEQVSMLEESFETENKLEPERKTQLAKHLGLHPRQVAVWFQNRRARWKTKQLERDYDLLKSSYDKLQSDHNSVLIHNETLKSQVVSLTEKLQAMAEKAPISDLLPVDRLSSGTGESAVVDEDGPQQLKDSCNSYFLTNDFGTPCIGPVQSEEEDRNDSRENYFADVFDTVTDQHQQQEEPLGWWVWS